MFRETDTLKPNKLMFEKLPHANYGYQHASVLTDLSFHPSEDLLMTAGLDRKVRLFEVVNAVKGQRHVNNVKVQESAKQLTCAFLPDLPVY